MTLEKKARLAGGSANRLALWRRPDSERGAALVEAAILLPLIVILIFGLVAFGRAYNAKVTATHAAREGVRVLAVTGDQALAETAASNAAASLNASLLTVDGSDPCVPGDPVEFNVTYAFTYDIPILGGRTVNIDETGVMRCSG